MSGEIRGACGRVASMLTTGEGEAEGIEVMLTAVIGVTVTKDGGEATKAGDLDRER